MGLNKKNIKIVLFCILVIALILGLSYRSGVKNNKLNKIENLFNEFEADYNKQLDIMIELNKFKKDSNDEVSKRATEYHGKIQQTMTDKAIIDEVNDTIKEMADYMKIFRIEKLQSINADSIYYKEAQSLISELGGASFNDENSGATNDTRIVIEYYSKHYSAGNKELNIKLKNTSGQDIEYLALDILEVDKDGNVINSDWTNTSALILNNASVSLDTYFDYQSSKSDLNFRVKDIRYK